MHNMPINQNFTGDARGCVEKWLIQVEESMRSAVRDIIDGGANTK